MIRGEANARFQSRYRTTISVAAALAATIHVAGALTAPPYAPTPFRYTPARESGWEIPPEYRTVEPPKPVTRPIIEEVPGVEDTPPVDLPETVFDPWSPPIIDRSGTPGSPVHFTVDPKPVRRVAPVYPDLARQAEATGTVHVLVTIDATGRVVDAVVVASTAIRSIERAALDAARQWLFTPAMQQQLPVKCTLVIPFVFSLR